MEYLYRQAGRDLDLSEEDSTLMDDDIRDEMDEGFVDLSGEASSISDLPLVVGAGAPVKEQEDEEEDEDEEEEYEKSEVCAMHMQLNF